MDFRLLKLFFVLSLYVSTEVEAFLEPAISTRTFTFQPGTKANASFSEIFQRSAFANTSIQISIGCDHNTESFQYSLKFVVRSSPCAKEFVQMLSSGPDDAEIVSHFDHPERAYFRADYKEVHIARGAPVDSTCHALRPLPGAEAVFYEVPVVYPVDDQGQQQQQQSQIVIDQNAISVRRRRAADDAGNSASKQIVTSSNLKSEKFHPVITLPVDSIYLLIIRVTSKSAIAVDAEPINVTLRVEWKADYGHLSAINWPLLPFYGVMCGLYAIYGFIWLVLSFWQWRDLLRIQYWIGAVILLGMLEKAVFYVEHHAMNTRGESVEGLIQFAEIVSCLKKTLARMLVIIVSVGFGVVKPRLGSTLHKVVGLGFVYFILCSIEAVVRVSKVQHDSQKQQQLVALPLTLLEVTICWWIFSALVNTMRALRLRRNEVKLSLYRHFTNVLIFAVLASVAFMLWSLIMHTYSSCLRDWPELWLDVGFWHILFSVILLVIMILWRPTNNNQRYAFSPLLDNEEDDDDDEDTVFDNVFTTAEATKLRTTVGSQQKVENRRSRDRDNSLEDELKWVDEHIPSSLADKALPALMDSDEEIQKTKFEISKMQ